MSERKQDEHRKGSVLENSRGRISRVAILVAVVLLLVLASGFVGTTAAQSTDIESCGPADVLNGYPDLQDSTNYQVIQDLEADLNDADFISGDPPCMVFENVNGASIDGQGYSIVEGNIEDRNDQGDGIFAEFEASNNEISNIDINNVGGSGIGVRGSDNSFSDITITNPNDNGITEDGVASGNTYTDISISGATNGIQAENGVFTNVTVTGSSGDDAVAGFGATLNRLELDSGQVTVPNGQNIAINSVSNPASPPMDPDGASATELGAYVDIDSETGSPDSNPNTVGNLRLFYDPSDLNADENATALADYGNGNWQPVESTTGEVNGENYVEVTETLGDEFVGDTSFEPATIGIFGRNTTIPKITNVTTEPASPIKYTYADVDDYDFFDDEGTVLDIRANLVDQFGDPLDPDPPSDSFRNDYVDVVSDGSGQFVADANDVGPPGGNRVSADGGLFYQYLTDMGPDDSVDITVGTGSPPSIPEIGEFEPATIQVNTMGVNLDLETVSSEPADGFAPNDSDSPNQIQLRATLTHENGDPVTVSEDVSFSVDRGNGSLSKTTGTTDSNGNVTLSYTVGEGDWEGLTGSNVVINASTSIEGYKSSAQTAFDVAVPDRQLSTVAQDGQVLLPDGSTTVVTTANYKAFDTSTVAGTPVEFTTDGNGTLDGGSPPVTTTTNSSGVATVTYSPVESDAGNDVTVTASDPDDGAPPDVIGDSDSFAVPTSEIDVVADFGVTAPMGGFDANVSIDSVDSAGNLQSELIDSKVTLNEGDSSLADSADTTTYSPDPINSNEEYRVRVTAEGYMNTSATAYVAPGETGTIDAGTLAPNEVDINATADLEVAAPNGTDVTFGLEDSGGTEIQSVTDEGVQNTASVGFEPAPALDFGESYTVTVEADGYETGGTTATTPGAPGDGTGAVDENVDIGELEAENTTVTASAKLQAKPGEPTQMELILVNNDEGGAVVDTAQPAELGAGETETNEATLTADFSNANVGAGDSYGVRATVVGGNENYEDGTVTVGTLEPRDSGADAGTVDVEAEPANVTADTELATTPDEGTATVTFSLINKAGDTVITGTDEVEPGETETDDVRLTADFGDADVSAETYTVQAEVTGGDDAYGGGETRVGILHPGDAVTTGDLVLEDEECINRRNVGRGEEDEECSPDREISRGGSRDDLNRDTSRRRDRGRGSSGR